MVVRSGLGWDEMDVAFCTNSLGWQREYSEISAIMSSIIDSIYLFLLF